MPSTSLPLSIGSTSTNASLASLLGSRYTVATANGEKTYILVKSAASLASPARKIVLSALSTGLPTFICDVTSTAALQPAFVIPSVYTATIATGTYYMAQVYGAAEVLSAAACAINVPIGTSTTAGKADDASITGGGIGYSLEAASGADENMAVMLIG